MTDELAALVQRLKDHKHWGMTEEAATAITTLRKCEARLRAQLAEARHLMHMRHQEMLTADGLMRKHQARADRAEQRVATLEHEVRLREAALAAQIEVTGWQPIETAPTDCTHVIGIDAKGCVARTRFFTPSSTREWLRVGLPGKAIWHPTRWKPLHELDAQPHDRTALDAVIRAAKVEAWREAADELKGQGYYTADRHILALIEKPE